jgi:hypothetical protein
MLVSLPTRTKEANANPISSFKGYTFPKEMDTIISMKKVPMTPGKKILATGRKMTLNDKSIVVGSCWTWVNEVFNRSGFGKNKQIIFKSKYAGPYADLSLIKPGDWLYYINYSYHAVQHSGIFVYWKDFDKRLAVVLSYRGRGRHEPGNYYTYDLKHVYYITRAVDK